MQAFNIIFLVFLSFFSFPLFAEQVCLKVNPMDTSHAKHPNIAREVKDMNKSFHVYSNQKTCFDLDKSYYMQYFMSENEKVIIYGTKCRYNPKPSHEGAVLVYKGVSGSSICPVENDTGEEFKTAVNGSDHLESIRMKKQAIRSSIRSFGFPRNFKSSKKISK